MYVCMYIYMYNCSVFLVTNFQIEYRQILSATTQNLVKADALLFWGYSDTWEALLILEALLTLGSGVDSSSVSVTKAAASSSDDSSSSGASVASASGSSPATSPATSST